MMQRLKDQRGDLNLIVAAIGLPVIFLFAFIGLDFVRVPLAQQVLQEALQHAAFDIVSEWDCGNGDSTQDAADTDDPYCLYRYINAPDPQVTEFGIDPFLPAAMDLAQDLNGATSTSTSPFDGVLNGSSSLSISEKAAKLAAHYIDDNSGLTLLSDHNRSIIFSILRIPVNPDNGIRTGIPFSDIMDGYSLPDVVSYSQMAEQASIPYRIRSPFVLLLRYTELSAASGSQPANVVGMSFPQTQGLDSTGNPYPPLKYVDSFWLVGVAMAKIQSTLGKFSMVGGNLPDEPGAQLVLEYVIRPMPNHFTISGRS